MRLARVIGCVVATRKERRLVGAKLLLTQPVDRDGLPVGGAQLAVDSVGAGVGELVLLVLEGRAAGAALGRRAAPVDAAIVGIVDPTGVTDRTPAKWRLGPTRDDRAQPRDPR